MSHDYKWNAQIKTDLKIIKMFHNFFMSFNSKTDVDLINRLFEGFTFHFSTIQEIKGKTSTDSSAYSCWNLFIAGKKDSNTWHDQTTFVGTTPVVRRSIPRRAWLLPLSMKRIQSWGSPLANRPFRLDRGSGTDRLADRSHTGRGRPLAETSRS